MRLGAEIGPKNFVFVTGAGASHAHGRNSYPLLNDLLPEMVATEQSQPNRGGRPKLYLAYSLGLAFGLAVKHLAAAKPVPENEIEQSFALVRNLPRDDLRLDNILSVLEGISGRAGELAYWALTHSIGVYMHRMYEAELNKDFKFRVDEPHRLLVELIDDLLLHGDRVSVVDFNYDCALENTHFSMGKPNFGWDCGRSRQVIASTSTSDSLSELAAQGRFEPALDDKIYPKLATLIKPHGDMSTFLRGSADVFHRGGRHSNVSTAVLPESLRDISRTDAFVRSSILPPTDSKHRHMAHFYSTERQRMVDTLRDCDVLVIIGWAARATDAYYLQVFHDGRSPIPALLDVHLIDYGLKRTDELELRGRINALLQGRSQFKSVQMRGFSEASVQHLRKAIQTV